MYQSVTTPRTSGLTQCAVAFFVVYSGFVWGSETPLRISLSTSDADRIVALKQMTSFAATICNETDHPQKAIVQWIVRSVAFEVPNVEEIPVLLGPHESAFYKFQLAFPKPGFAEVQCKVSTTDTSTAAHLRVCCQPEKVKSPLTKASDFADFWKESLNALSKVAPSFQVLPRPDKSREKVDVFEIRMRGHGDIRLGGWLEVPHGPGPFPAVIRFPGYGQAMQPIAPWDDVVVFSFNPRGHGNSMQDVPGKPNDYWIRGLDNRFDYFYRGAYLDCVRAVDFIATRDEIDPSRIAVWGESQGGGLAFATAALDRRIDLCVADIPFLCDWVNYFQLSNWPEMDEWIATSPERNWSSTLRTLSYFDTLNFADRIRCPTIMAVGLQDRVCPPTTSFSTFQRITTARKHFKIYPDAAHGLGKTHYDWVTNQIHAALYNADGSVLQTAD